MPKSGYHPLDGNEVGVILKNRFDQAIMQALDLRAFRVYPLLKYRITVELIPYQEAGQHADGSLIVEPDKAEIATFDGHEYIMVEQDAVVLSEDSKIIGLETDPQDLRMGAGMGKLVTKKVDGHVVDDYVGANAIPQAPAPEPPPLITTESNPAKTPSEEQEERDWQPENLKGDDDFNAAIAEGRDLPGRVTVGGADARKKGKQPPPRRRPNG